MAIERELCAFFDASGNARSKADVRNKVPVHDVKVDESRATVFNGLKAVTEGEKICVQDAGSDDLFKHTTNLKKILLNLTPLRNKRR